MRLIMLPSGNVTVSIASNNTDVAVVSSTLTFSMGTWSTAQTVTVPWMRAALAIPGIFAALYVLQAVYLGLITLARA